MFTIIIAMCSVQTIDEVKETVFASATEQGCNTYLLGVIVPKIQEMGGTINHQEHQLVRFTNKFGVEGTAWVQQIAPIEMWEDVIDIC